MRPSRKPLPMIPMGLIVGMFVLALGVREAPANTLHGFCGASFATTSCPNGATITPTSQNPLSPFGFTRSPDTNQNLTNPTITLEFLIPNNDTVSFGAFSSGTTTGSPTSVTPSLFSLTAWTSGDLIAFLGDTQVGGPNNPINAYLPSTQTQDAGATGYFVYQARFGTVAFGNPDPLFTDSTTLPVGAVILGLVQWTGVGTPPSQGQTTCAAGLTCVQDATANSSALLITGGGGGGNVPEPATLLLLGCGLVGLWGLRSRKGGR